MNPTILNFLRSIKVGVGKLYHGTRYRIADVLATRRSSVPGKREVEAYVRATEMHPEFERTSRVKEISMLHTEVLLLLRYLARRSSGVIVEFGPYVGGSTVMLGGALVDSVDRPIVVVEPGGAHGHPTIPSEDIFGDLEKNLEKYGCRDRISLIRGFSYQEETRAEIEKIVGDGRIGMLVIDSDGQVENDINRYHDLLSDDCILILDDYSSKRAPEKQTLIKKWVEDAEAVGRAETFGIYGWGTWFGIYHSRVLADG